MKHTHSSYRKFVRFAILGALIVLPTASTRAASIFTETWPTDGDFRAWLGSTLGIGGPNAHTVSGGAVNFNVAMGGGPFLRGYQLDAAYVVRNASDGAFEGNTITAGAKSVQFDFALDSDSLGTAENPMLVLFMGGVGAGGLNNYWEYRVTPPAVSSGFTTVVAGLTDSTGWVQTLGTGSFAEATQNVQSWAIQYRRFQPGGPNSGFSASGRVDNFALSTAVPEPSASLLMGLFGGLILWRRTRR
ncbi:MAG: PEP-CTERM sorting domain-containing protein [Akkermansiaceae bacterium]|nr:PEP-CTERM sorting domain-containing protein [Akkermansiaceae bacterium]